MFFLSPQILMNRSVTLPVFQEIPSSIPTEHQGNHMIPPPSIDVISFDWGPLIAFRLPSYVPFQITVQAYNMVVPGTILDEGASVSIMSSTTWQVLGSPQLVPVTQNLLALNGGTSQPLGILPEFPITLGGKTIYIDVMVVQGPLDFNLLLGRNYVYVMGALVSSLFRVVYFPHDERIVTIDQLSFIGHQVPPLQPSSPIGSCLKVVSSPPQVNYMATLFVSAYADDHIDGIVHYLLGALEIDMSLIPNDMYFS